MNSINFVREVIREKQLGWPNGTSHLYKVVDVLLKRIEELEKVAQPLARAYYVNQTTGNAAPLLNVEASVGKQAFDQMDTQQSAPVKRDTFFNMPAE